MRILVLGNRALQDPTTGKRGKGEMGEVALEEKAVRKDLEFPGALSHLLKE